MAVLMNGSTDQLSIAEGPLSTKFSVTFWARLLSDQDQYTGPLGFFGSASKYFIPGGTISDGMDARILWASPGSGDAYSDVMNAADLYTIDRWEFFFATVDGTSLECKALSSGEDTFQDTASDTSNGNYTAWTSFILGRDPFADWQNAEIGSAKIWSNVILSDVQALGERLYFNPQNEGGSIWAVYKLASGALTVDSIGNGKTLSAAGTPTFASDPSDILGDDPVVGGGVFASYYQQYYRSLMSGIL